MPLSSEWAVTPAAMTMAAVIGACRHIVGMWMTYDEMRTVTASAIGSFHSVGPPTDQKEQADDATDQHVDDAAPEHPHRLGHLGIGRGDHRGDGPDRIGVGDVFQRVPDDGGGDEHVQREADPDDVTPELGKKPFA